jgi:hypothetical protein
MVKICTSHHKTIKICCFIIGLVKMLRSDWSIGPLYHAVFMPSENWPRIYSVSRVYYHDTEIDCFLFFVLFVKHGIPVEKWGKCFKHVKSNDKIVIFCFELGYGVI